MRPASGTRRARRLRHARPPTRSCDRASATARSAARRWRPSSACARGLADDLRRAVVVARDREVVRARSAPAPLRAGTASRRLPWRRSARRGSRRGPGRRPRPSSSCAEKSCARSVGRRSRAAGARCARSRPCRCRSASARRGWASASRPACGVGEPTTSRADDQRGVGAGEAAAEDQRDLAARRLRARRDRDSPAQSGSSVAQRRDAGHDVVARARRARARFRGCRRRRSGGRTPT